VENKKTRLPLVEFAPWSPSKADLANTCALAFKYRYVEKIKSDTKGSAAKIGTAAHRVQEHVLNGEHSNQAVALTLDEYAADLTTMEVEKVRSFTPNIEAFKIRLDRLAQKHPVANVFVEKKWAITQDFSPCDWDAPDAMIRGVVDLALELESGQLLIIDHKSGRPWGLSKYMTQLDIYAIFGLAHVSRLKAVQCGVHYISNADLKWADVRKAEYIITVLQPWLLNLLNARTLRLEGFTPTVSRYCSWCDFRNICPARETGNAAESEAETENS
jgi:hypothetical protein